MLLYKRHLGLLLMNIWGATQNFGGLDQIFLFDFSKVLDSTHLELRVPLHENVGLKIKPLILYRLLFFIFRNLADICFLKKIIWIKRCAFLKREKKASLHCKVLCSRGVKHSGSNGVSVSSKGARRFERCHRTHFSLFRFLECTGR